MSNNTEYASISVIDEMIELKNNLAVMSKSNMENILAHLSESEKDVLLRLYINDSRNK